jgi:uncharacterized protein YndB with AHSA1/START domain
VTSHTVAVRAPAEVVYRLVTDIERMASWSPEIVRCRWIRGATRPEPGAKYRGWSRRGWRVWSTTSTVTVVEPGELFEWRVTYLGLRVATWTYRIDASDGGSTVTETVVDQRGRLLRRVSPLITGSPDRRSRNAETMQETLAQVAAAAETVAGATP